MSEPTLSVIMPNYNYAHFIGEALEAVLSQSFRPKEVIVVDDGSTDDSVQVVKRLMTKFPNIRLLENGENRGIIYTYNRGLKEASGDFVYGAASDDKVLPGFFQRSMSLLKEHPGAGLCCTDTEYSEAGEIVERRFQISKSPSFFPPDEVVRILLKRPITFIISQTVIIDRLALLKAGGYIPELGWTCDTFASHVVAFRHGVCYIPEILTLERRHSQQQGTREVKQISNQAGVVRSAIRLLKDPKYSDVLSMFKRTAPFSIYPWEVFCVIMNEREFGYFSFKVFWFALLDKLVKRPLKQLAAMMMQKYRGWSVDAAFRYLPIVQEIKRSAIRNPSILDVGSGSLGITPYLKMPVTGADIVFDGPVSKFLKPIKFDGLTLPFKDGEFDYVLSVDMLEHVLPDKREQMVRELIRVTKRKLFLAAPMGKDSEEQDAVLDKLYRKIWGKPFQFMEEHVLNGLPSKEWVGKIIPELCSSMGRTAKVRSEKNLNLKFRYFAMRLSISSSKVLNYMDNVIALMPFVRLLVNFGKCYRQIYTVSFEL